MEEFSAVCVGLTDNDRSFLLKLKRSLPLLADVARADVLLYCLSHNSSEAVALAEAKPHTVPSIYTESMAGRRVSINDEPAVVRTVRQGKHSQRLSRVLVHGAPTIQEVFPVVSENRTIGALSVEIGLLEFERQRKKSLVYRRAVAQVRSMALRGQLDGAASISALGEHDGPFVVDNSGQIVYISSIAENLYRKLGYSHSLLRSNISDLATDESVFFKAVESGGCVEQLVQEGAFSWLKKAIPLVAHNRRDWWHALPGPLARAREEIDGAIVIIHDLTGERQREQELRIKSAMIKEVHHRVKNNLQTIAALLRLQMRRTSSAEVEDVLRQTINRILSIAVVHEFLAYDEASTVDVKEVCQRIVNEVSQSIIDPDKRVRFDLEGASVYLPAQQATSCALILNELLQNAVKHGFAGRSEGVIEINLHDVGDELRMVIADNGRGLRPGFELMRDGSLGLQIVSTLVREDLKGQFALQNGQGVRAQVTFPKVQQKLAKA